MPHHVPHTSPGRPQLPQESVAALLASLPSALCPEQLSPLLDRGQQHSPGMLEMHRTWALHTVNWSTTVPGWLASMITTLLVLSVLVRTHTRLEVASASGVSFACFRAWETEAAARRLGLSPSLSIQITGYVTLLPRGNTVSFRWLHHWPLVQAETPGQSLCSCLLRSALPLLPHCLARRGPPGQLPQPAATHAPQSRKGLWGTCHSAWLLGLGKNQEAAEPQACWGRGECPWGRPMHFPPSCPLCHSRADSGTRCNLSTPTMAETAVWPSSHCGQDGTALPAPPTFFSGDVWLLLVSPSISRSQVRGSRPGTGLTALPESSSPGFHRLRLTPAAHHS